MSTPEHPEHPEPEQTVTQAAAPDQAAPDQAAPDQAAPEHTADDVAEWLLGRILDADPRPFPQANAVRIARELFGEDWGVLNVHNVPSLHPDVLEAFARIKAENVRWNTRAKAWWVADEERMRAFRLADEKKARKAAAKSAREEG